jgi:hypothetical protein
MGEVVDKYEEVLFYEDITYLLGFCDLLKLIEDGSK